MASAGTTHTEVPSLRRVYRSRALRSARVASGACSEPACTWERPRLARTKTSHRGQAWEAAVVSLMGQAPIRWVSAGAFCSAWRQA